MRIAVFSDVHGNLTALEAALADIGRHEVDQVVAAGDLCAMGPKPLACLERIRDNNIQALYGNTDEWLLGRLAPPEHLAAAARWAADRLTDEARQWLADLPFRLRFSPTGRAEDDMLIVHANPLDVNRIIFPSEAEQMARYGRLRQTDAELEPLVAGLDAAVLAFGHLHIPNVRLWRGKPLVNISSISLPGDGDPRAKYAIFEWVDDGWTFAHHHVVYDLDAEARAVRAAQIPGWEEAMRSLETQRFIPQKV